MNEIEERIKAAALATRRTFPYPSLPPLRLAPVQPGRAAPKGWRRSSRGNPWLIPLAAAAGVIAVIIAAVAITHGPGGTASGAPATGPEGTPPYYVFLPARYPRGVVEPVHLTTGPAQLASTATGRILATIKPPRPYTRFVVVTGAADDRTFVLGAYRSIHVPRGTPGEVIQFYRLRFNPARGSVKLTRLPVRLQLWLVGAQGFALSPDGAKLAVALGTASPVTIKVYTLATGASRTWTGRNMNFYAGFSTLSWSGDGQTLGYSWQSTRANPYHYRSYFSLLNTSVPGTSLNLPDTSVPGIVPPPRSVEYPPDSEIPWAAVAPGGTIIFPTSDKSFPWGIREYSVITRRPVHHLAATASHGQVGTILWANATGSVMIVIPVPSLPRERVGVLGHGHYLPLPGNNFSKLELIDPWSIAW